MTFTALRAPLRAAPLADLASPADAASGRSPLSLNLSAITLPAPFSAVQRIAPRASAADPLAFRERLAALDAQLSDVRAVANSSADAALALAHRALPELGDRIQGLRSRVQDFCAAELPRGLRGLKESLAGGRYSAAALAASAGAALQGARQAGGDLAAKASLLQARAGEASEFARAHFAAARGDLLRVRGQQEQSAQRLGAVASAHGAAVDGAREQQRGFDAADAGAVRAFERLQAAAGGGAAELAQHLAAELLAEGERQAAAWALARDAVARVAGDARAAGAALGGQLPETAGRLRAAAAGWRAQTQAWIEQAEERAENQIGAVAAELAGLVEQTERRFAGLQGEALETLRVAKEGIAQSSQLFEGALQAETAGRAANAGEILGKYQQFAGFIRDEMAGQQEENDELFGRVQAEGVARADAELGVLALEARTYAGEVSVLDAAEAKIA
jgi:hypothetical protein